MGFRDSRDRSHWAVVVLELVLLLSLYLLNTLPGCSGKYIDMLKEFNHSRLSKCVRFLRSLGSRSATEKKDIATHD